MTQGWFTAGRDSEWSSRFRQACKAGRIVQNCKADNANVSEKEVEMELNGVEQEEDRMSDEEGRETEGEGEVAAPDWRVRAGPRIKPTQREREEHEATHVPFRDWCAYCMMGRGRTHHHVAKQKSEDQSRRPIIAMDYFFMRMESSPNVQLISEELITCM